MYDPLLLLLPIVLVGGRELNSISVVRIGGDDDMDDGDDSNDCACKAIDGGDGGDGGGWVVGVDDAGEDDERVVVNALPMSHTRFADSPAAVEATNDE